MSEPHHRRLERMYLVAPCNRPYEPTIEITKGEAVITMPVKEETFHAGGSMHGSVAFKALDDAAYFAVNSLVKDEFVVTASFHVHFLRPVKEGTLTAKGRVVSRTRRHHVAESVLYDDKEREVARGTGTFVPSGLKLKDVPDYADG